MEEKNKYKPVETTAEAIDKLEETPEFQYKNISGKDKPAFARAVSERQFGKAPTKKEEAKRAASVKQDIDEYYKDTKNTAPSLNDPAKRQGKDENVALKKGHYLSTPSNDEASVNRFLRGLPEGKAQQEILKYGSHLIKEGETPDPFEYGDEERKAVLKENKDLFEKQGISQDDNLLNASSKKVLDAISSGIEDKPAEKNEFYNILRGGREEDIINDWKTITPEQKEKIFDKYSNDIGKLVGVDLTKSNRQDAIKKLDDYILSGNFKYLGDRETGPIIDFLNNFTDMSQDEKRDFILKNKNKFESVYGNIGDDNESIDKIIDTIENTDRSQVIGMFKEHGIASENEKTPTQKAYNSISSLDEDTTREFLGAYWDDIKKIDETFGEDIFKRMRDGTVQDMNVQAATELNKLLDKYINTDLKEKEAQEYLSGKATNIEHLQSKYNLEPENDSDPFWQDVDDFIVDDIQNTDSVLNSLNLDSGKVDKKEILNNVSKQLAEKYQISEEDIPVLQKFIKDRVNETINNMNSVNSTRDRNIEEISKGYSRSEENLLSTINDPNIKIDDIRTEVRGNIFDKGEIFPRTLGDNDKERITNDVITKFGLEDSPELRNALSPVIDEHIKYANNFAKNFSEDGISVRAIDNVYSGLISDEKVQDMRNKVYSKVNRIVDRHPEWYENSYNPEKAKQIFIDNLKLLPNKKISSKAAREMVWDQNEGAKVRVKNDKTEMEKNLTPVVRTLDKTFASSDDFYSDDIQKAVDSIIYDYLRQYVPDYKNLDFTDFLLDDGKDKKMQELKELGKQIFLNRFNAVQERKHSKDER